MQLDHAADTHTNPHSTLRSKPPTKPPAAPARRRRRRRCHKILLRALCWVALPMCVLSPLPLPGLQLPSPSRVVPLGFGTIIATTLAIALSRHALTLGSLCAVVLSAMLSCCVLSAMLTPGSCVPSLSAQSWRTLRRSSSATRCTRPPVSFGLWATRAAAAAAASRSRSRRRCNGASCDPQSGALGSSCNPRHVFVFDSQPTPLYKPPLDSPPLPSTGSEALKLMRYPIAGTSTANILAASSASCLVVITTPKSTTPRPNGRRHAGQCVSLLVLQC